MVENDDSTNNEPLRLQNIVDKKGVALVLIWMAALVLIVIIVVRGGIFG